jgi:hypothetical protein
MGSNQYRSCFAERYRKSDARPILLAYKIQYRLNKIAREIDGAAKGYTGMCRGRRTSCGRCWCTELLNHGRLSTWLESSGRKLLLDADFTQDLVSLGVQSERHVIREAVSEKKFKEQLDEQRLSFLRTKALYLHCREVAEGRYD